jgi:predicted nucleic acid-binding protein
VIGGRVLDASAVMAFASQRSVYAAALVWTVVQEHMVLVLPSAAVAAAWSQLDAKYHPLLEVLLRLPNTVIDDLDADRARAVGQLEPGDLEAAHAVACAQRRGWPLVTTDATRYKEFNVEVPAEELP